MVVPTAMNDMLENKPSTSMAHVACESKLRSLVRSTKHPYPEQWMAIGPAVVNMYYAGAALAFTAGIKRRQCM